MLTPKYARLLWRYLRRRLFTAAGWRWRTDGLVFFGKAPRDPDPQGRRDPLRPLHLDRRRDQDPLPRGLRRDRRQDRDGPGVHDLRLPPRADRRECVIADRAMFIDFDHGVADVEKPVREQGIYMRDVTSAPTSGSATTPASCAGSRSATTRSIGANAVVTERRPRERRRRRRAGEGDPHARGARRRCAGDSSPAPARSH